MKKILIILLIVLSAISLSACDAKFKKDTRPRLTKLHHAAFSGDTELAENLLKRRSTQIDYRDKNGNTPLHLAVRQNHLEMVKLLVEKGADMEAANNAGLTPLSDARVRGFKEIEDYLIDRGAMEQ